METFLCWIWPYLMGGLLGWLAAGLLARRALARKPATVERLVDRPVDRIVEKVVEKVVDNPSHLAQIASLTATAALVPTLRSQLAAAESAPPKVVEKIVEMPVDRIVEKTVVDVAGIEARDREIASWRSRFGELEAQMARTPATVERLVDRPVDRIVEKVVEKVVDNPSHLAQIASLTATAALVPTLRSQLAAAESAPPRVVEKIVEMPVDRIVEKTVVDVAGIEARDREIASWRSRFGELEAQMARTPATVERLVDRPVDRIVEKVVEKVVDNPSHLAQIASLTATAALVPTLRSQLAAAESAPPKVIEKIVEMPVDRIVEKTVVDVAGIEARDREIASWRSRFGELEARMQGLNEGPAIDMEAARAAGFAVSADELEIVEGIGPKIAEVLRAAGVHRFWQLARMTPADIQPILDEAGPRFKLAVPDTWPEQALLAANNHWNALKSLQDVLSAGVRK